MEGQYRNYPKTRQWVGVECCHCHSHNTVIEVYDFSKERYCLTCARYDTF